MATPTSLPTATGPTRLAALEGRPILGYVGPNWFASVMGTGIVAVAAATLPDTLPGLLDAATVVWVLAALLLVVVSGATAGHWIHHPDVARSHLAHPTMGHFYGAVPMALLTVGAGAVLVGDRVIGATPALVLDLVLWSVGTVLGLLTAVVVPLRAFASGPAAPDAAFGGWLMPVVPPMVSAATLGLLLPHVPAGQPRLTLLLLGYALFGITLLASLVVIALIWGRLVHHGIGAAAAVPTLWIVLGPLGQSVTAAQHLGAAAPGILPAPYGTGLEAAGLAYGVPVWGFAMLWLAVVAVITLRTARSGLPFSLTWWSFTFPVGTVVTGTSALAVTTGAVVLQVAAGVLFVGLVAAWTVVATRTAAGAWSGRLLCPPAQVSSADPVGARLVGP